MGRVVIHRLAAHASSVPLHGLLLVIHELVESQLSPEALALVGVFTAHSEASSTTSDWLHDFPIENEVHGVSLAEGGIRQVVRKLHLSRGRGHRDESLATLHNLILVLQLDHRNVLVSSRQSSLELLHLRVLLVILAPQLD